MNKIDIANLALNHLGIGRTIASFDEASEEASAIKAVFDIAVNTTLQDGIWSFAKRKQPLSLLETTTSEKYTHIYALPQDCIRIISLVSGQPFELLLKTPSQKVLLTNDENAVLVYTSNSVDSSLYPSTFIMALSYQLAFLIAFRLTGKRELVEMSFKLYEHYILKSQYIDYNEEEPEIKDVESEFIKARY